VTFDEAHVRNVLRHASLNISAKLLIHGSGIPSFYPRTNEIHVPENSDDFSILHEGAHAEHWDKMRSAFDQSALDGEDFYFGMSLISEAYVGHQLASVDGYLDRERARFKRLDFKNKSGSIAEFFDQIRTIELFVKKNNSRDTLPESLSLNGVRYVMYVIQLAIVESVRDEKLTLRGIEIKVNSVYGEFMRSLLLDIMQFAENQESMVNREMIEAFGATTRRSISDLIS